jgi:hypothetical protein
MIEQVFTGALGGMEPLMVAAGGFAMKMSAQSQAIAAENHKMALEGLGASTEGANEAAGRGGAWMRRYIVLAVFTTLFGGIFYFARDTSITTLYAYMTPVKDGVLGMWQSGGKLKTLETNGFLVTPEMWRMAINICFFYFGAGVAKTR